MNRRKLPLLLALLLTTSLFHRCNEDEALEAISTLADGPQEAPLMKQVTVQDDKNLSYALEEFFASNLNARRSPIADFDSTHVIMIRDENHNVIRYSVALENGDNPGIKNLVLSVTPKREVFAHIFSYVPDDPEKLFFGIEEFTGEMIITDLDGNEVGRSYLVDGQSPGAEETINGRTSSTCVTKSYYTTVYTPYGSHTSLDYTKTTCYSDGGDGGAGAGGDGEFEAGGGGGGSTVAVNRALSTVSSNSQLPSNPRDGQIIYIRNGDGTVTELVYLKALDAWLMPELVHVYYDQGLEIDIASNRPPTFNGAVLMTMALPALAEPSPVGEIVWAGTAVVITTVYIIDLAHYYQSKGGPRNIWPDQYGYPPDPKTIDWSKSDSELANDISNEHNDPDRGPRSPNNLVKKWLNRLRP